jgi:hypothetical protein
MYRTIAVTLALALALPVVAAEKPDAEARARTVAPFLDAQTVAVAHVDLTRIDAGALLDWAVEAGHLDAKGIGEQRRELRGWLADLTRAGGKELYVVVNLADLPTGPPLVVVPLASGADAAAVRRALGRTELYQHARFETRDQTLVGGSEDALKRLRTSKPVPRPELASAFTAAGDTTAQLLLLPTADSLRVVSEMLPTVPPQAGGGSTRPLTHGLMWAALGVDLPPKAALRSVLQCRDADSARALKDFLARTGKALGGVKEVRDLLPAIDRIVELLTPEVEGDRLIVSLGDKELAAVLPPLARRTSQSVEQQAATGRLRDVVIAMHGYADSNKGRFPAEANFDKQGKPLLSWRVHLLPFVGEQKLYKEFHLDEPWDSPHNRALIARMPPVYQGPNWQLNRDGKTIYLAPVGKDVAFSGRAEGARMPADFPDGTSNTIMLVEADNAHAVPWTKPEDLEVDLDHPERGLGGHFPGGFLVGLADGSVRFLSSAISKATLRAAFTRSGGEVLGSDW